MDSLSFEQLRVANTTREKEWEGDTEGGFSPLFLSNAMCGEAGETANVIKKLERERLGFRGSRATVDELAAEIADVVIYADLLARSMKIDLGKAVRDKFNATSTKYGLERKL